jgi:hypothetical protein
MQESEVPIEHIKTEIRESLERVKAMVADSEAFVRDHTQRPREVGVEPA